MPINDPEKSENMRKSIRVYSGSSNRPLAQKIAEYLGVELSGLTLKQFANGEIYARYDETVRGADVFLIQSVAGGNVNDMLMELLIATDAAKRASAGFAGGLVLWCRVTAGGLSAWQKCKKVPARHGVRLCPVGYAQRH